jgi:glycosyltransferase involved in cell wall biosynthesis
VVDPLEVCPDLDGYRRYVESSKGEWSVAKHGYVAGRPGWFSCRSACYLAAGRPVVVQDTGFGEVLQVGQGIVAFATLGEAVEGIRDVEARYSVHSRAAREIAEEYFNSDRVLAHLVEEAMGAAVQGGAEEVPA